MSTDNTHAKALYEALARADRFEFPDDWDELCESFRATLRAGASAVLAATTAPQPANEAQPVALALQADNERLRARIKELEGSRGERWCSACHEYVKDCCAGDARACPLIFPKD